MTERGQKRGERKTREWGQYKGGDREGESPGEETERERWDREGERGQYRGRGIPKQGERGLLGQEIFLGQDPRLRIYT